MKQNAKRTLCILTAAAVASSVMMFTGCKKDEGGAAGSSGNVSVSDSVVQAALSYKTAEIKSPKNMNQKVVYFDGKLFGINNYYVKNGEETRDAVSIIVFNEQGELIKEIPIDSTEDADGYVYINGALQVNESGITYMFEKSGAEGTSQELRTIDFEGNVVRTVDISAALKDDYLSGWTIDKDGDLFVSTGTAVKAIDPDGKELFSVQPDGGNTYIMGLFTTNEGKPALSYMATADDTFSAVITVVDKETKSLGKKINVAGDKGWQMQPGSGDYICYCSGDTGIVGIKEDGTIESVLNLLTVGVDNSNMEGFSAGDSGEFYITLYSFQRSGCDIVKVYPIEGSEANAKQIITLGCFSADWTLRTQVADFNKNSDEYTIYVNSYSDLKDTSDMSAAMTNFNNELLAGKVPDILLVTQDMPYQSYESKGLFTDLYEYIDKDPDLSKESFLPNILRAYESDGKLYRLGTSYHVKSYAIKPSLLKGDTLSVKDAREAMSSLPAGAEISKYYDRATVLSEAIAFSDFIDHKNKTCNFDNPEFKAILEMAKEFPEEVDLDKMMADNPNFYLDYFNVFLEDNTLVYPVTVNDFVNLTWTRASLGDEFELVNFPTDMPAAKGLVDSNSLFAVSNTSKNKDGAWNFIKYCLQHNIVETPYFYYDNAGNYVQTSDIKYSTKTDDMPVLISEFELLKSHACDPNYEYDADGTRKEADITTYVGGEKKLPPMSQQELDKFTKLLTESDTVSDSNEDIMKIINDEASGYFSGTKSLDETVSLIQNRVNIYMSEHY